MLLKDAWTAAVCLILSSSRQSHLSRKIKGFELKLLLFSKARGFWKDTPNIGLQSPDFGDTPDIAWSG